jgi:hypothetical protein
LLAKAPPEHHKDTATNRITGTMNRFHDTFPTMLSITTPSCVDMHTPVTDKFSDA